MPEFTGRLIVDLHPAGTVRMVFIGHTGGGYESPLTARSLDAAEIDFARICGLTPERAFSAVRRARMLQASLPRMEVAGRCVQQNTQLEDNW
jgi:hypothetical protein